jgi:hypothetical protein
VQYGSSLTQTKGKLISSVKDPFWWEFNVWHNFTHQTHPRFVHPYPLPRSLLNTEIFFLLGIWLHRPLATAYVYAYPHYAQKMCNCIPLSGGSQG